MEPKGGGAHGLVGRPPSGPTDLPLLSCGLFLLAHLSLACVLAFVMSVSCSGGPSNPCFDMCRVLIRRNIMSWIMLHRFAANFA